MRYANTRRYAKPGRDATRRLLTLTFCAMIAGAGLAGCTSKKVAAPDAAVASFLAGWRAHGFAPTLSFVDASGASVPGATVTSDITTLSGDLASIAPKLTAAAAVVTKNTATDAITVAWPLTPATSWTYQTTLHLSRNGSVWSVVWSPDVIAPKLTEGATLRLDHTAAARGDILGGDGKPIVTARAVVTVGVVPHDVTDVTSLVASLQTAFDSVHLGLDLSGLASQIKAAQPEEFVEVVTLRQEVYTQIRSQIHDLPGTQFRQGTLDLAPTKTFARALLGTVDDVTKERMDANPGKYRVGDQVGFGGIEEAYEDRLRGSPGVSVVIPGKGQASDGTANPDTVLFTTAPVAGQPVKTGLDMAVQNAADGALVGVASPAAVVAMRISNGAILAIANGPGASGLDLALTAQVPPGSTFKTVTATNVLESGALTPDSIVNCPAQFTVDGRSFTNFDGEVLGNVTLQTDFAKSCNTAFASLYPKLGYNGLTTTAAQLGVGGKWTVGVATFTGSVPADGSGIDQAAAAFGQGKTLVSPMAMCGVAAAVARGHWLAPTVITDPAVTGNPAPGTPLKPATVDDLKQMMRAVVTSGTGTKVANVPGGPVFGKTGTAENPGGADHSWFIGYQGDIAFAVFVQNGGVSTAGAVPIAATFLTALH